MFATVLSALTVATIAVAAFGVGRPLIRALRVGDGDRLSVGVWSISAGLIAVGLLLAVLGQAGLLYKSLIGVLTLVAGFWGIGELSRSQSRRQVSARSQKANALDSSGAMFRSKPPRWLAGGILTLAGLAAAGSFIGAAAPPTAGDALCYHLELPKRFLLEQALVYLPDSDNSANPLLVENWYLWALALDGGVAAQMVHWGLGVLLALAAVVLATPVLGRPWSWCVGCLVLLVPGINNQMTAPLNDVALALFTTLALAAWWRGAIDDDGRRWFVLAGWMLGGALGTKHSAILFAIAWLLVALASLWRQRSYRRIWLTGAAIIATVALSVSGIWYLRAAFYTGNPVYPFFDEYLGARAATDPSGLSVDHAPPSFPADKAPLGRDLRALLTAPWQVTMHPERFGGRGHQLGALFLATLPGLACCRRLRGMGTFLSISAVYVVGWTMLRQNVRFLFPLVPLLAMPVVWVWIEIRRLPRVPASLVGALTIGVLIIHAAAGTARARGCLAVCLGLESRDDYLLRREPSYRAAAWANALLDPGIRILSQEQRAFYFNARVARENVYRRRTGYDRHVASAAELARHLAGEGFTHLLLAETTHGSGIRYNPTLSKLADLEHSGTDANPFHCLTEYRFTSDDGTVRRYRLMKVRH